jgi:hypothetical protein
LSWLRTVQGWSDHDIALNFGPKRPKRVSLCPAGAACARWTAVRPQGERVASAARIEQPRFEAKEGPARRVTLEPRRVLEPAAVLEQQLAAKPGRRLVLAGMASKQPATRVQPRAAPYRRRETKPALPQSGATAAEQPLGRRLRAGGARGRHASPSRRRCR